MRHTWQVIGGWAVALLMLASVAHAETAMTIYDFEGGLQDWSIPDWAKEKEEDVGRIVTASQEVASSGLGSMQLLADFPGGAWTGSYVEVFMYVTDWSQFGEIAVDVYLPADAPTGLKARFILTVGEAWTWTEMNRAIVLEPGDWTTITANLKPGSLDWKFFPTDEFRKDVRKVGLRVESDKTKEYGTSPVYSGPIYFDNIRLSS